MTYRTLLATLQTLTQEQLDSDVTVYNQEEDEYYQAGEVGFEDANTSSILDPNHPFITFPAVED